MRSRTRRVELDDVELGLTGRDAFEGFGDGFRLRGEEEVGDLFGLAVAGDGDEGCAVRVGEDRRGRGCGVP